MIYIILIILTLILLLIIISFYNINKNQKEIIKELNNITNKLLEKKEITINNPDSISIEKISKEQPILNNNKFIPQNNLSTTKNIEKEHLNLENYYIKNNHKSSSIDYLKEVSNKLINELKEKNIELTDFEKKEEENAIISYKQLLNNNKLSKEETKEFIDNLKKLRNSLK